MSAETALPLMLGALGLLSPAAQAEPALSRTQSFELPLACTAAMPLFTAPGERLWAPGWEPEMLSGGTERGSVFRTLHQRHETVWIVAEYAPDQGRASYARIAQGSNMGMVDVRCRALDAGRSEISVTYTLTGLTPAGRTFVQGFLAPEAYAAFIQEWRTAILAALQHPPRG
jgi:hypothetical protein